MSKKIMLIALAFVLVVALVFTGCAPARRPITTDQYNKAGLNRNINNQYDYRTNYSDLNRTNTGSNLGTNTNQNTATGSSDQLVTTVKQVPGVRNATVVISGSTAYVGIDIDRTTGTANETTIRNDVTQRIRAADRNITTVYVSTDATFIDRLRNYGNQIRSGRPVEGFTNDLNNMFQTGTPTR